MMNQNVAKLCELYFRTQIWLDQANVTRGDSNDKIAKSETIQYIAHIYRACLERLKHLYPTSVKEMPEERVVSLNDEFFVCDDILYHSDSIYVKKGLSESYERYVKQNTDASFNSASPNFIYRRRPEPLIVLERSWTHFLETLDKNVIISLNLGLAK